MTRDAAKAVTADSKVTNVIIAGLGGQGVIKASDILADVAFRAGLDVKKSEIHGMSQRGGSVHSDVRFGRRVLSPMVPAGEADVVVVLSADQIELNRGHLKASGALIGPDAIDESALPNKKALNVALLGALSRRLDIAEEHWRAALEAGFEKKHHAGNAAAFALGRGK